MPSEMRLSARSVIASTLLGSGDDGLPIALLVRSASLFGISEGAARTALSRLNADGDVLHDGSWVRCSGRLAQRRDRQLHRHLDQRPWDGTWVMAIVTNGRRSASDRAALRRAAGELSLAELREGVWARPDNLDPARQATAQAIVAQQCIAVSNAELDVDPYAVWPLREWARRARDVSQRAAAVGRALDDHDVPTLRRAFVVMAQAIGHLQTDPLLPPELVADRSGEVLRAELQHVDERFRASWKAWLGVAPVATRT